MREDREDREDLEYMEAARPESPAIAAIDLWNCSLTNLADAAPVFAPLLSAEERERASRFRFGRLGDAYTVGRGMTRVILGKYVSIPPAELRFVYGPNGKPRLASGGAAGSAAGLPSGEGVYFNVSHSGAVMVCAVTRAGEIGVDVEQIRPKVEAREIAERFFHTAEAAELQGLGGDALLETFFRCWTRKEAFVKATGEGLARNMASYRVSCRAGEPARLLRISDPDDDPAAWSLYSFAPAPGYCSAVAIRHPRISVRIIEATPGTVFPCR